MPVTVDRDDQFSSSPTPVTGSDRREEASQPKGGFIDLSRKGSNVTDTTAETAKSKPATIREFERALQTLGFSQRESKAVASGGFKAIHPVQQLDEQITALADSLAKYKSIFES